MKNSKSLISFKEISFEISRFPKNLDCDGGTVKLALQRSESLTLSNQSWTKIKKYYPNFSFSNYEEFCSYCNKLYCEDKFSIYKISKIVKLSEDIIKTAVKYNLSHFSLRRKLLDITLKLYIFVLFI